MYVAIPKKVIFACVYVYILTRNFIIGAVVNSITYISISNAMVVRA